MVIARYKHQTDKKGTLRTHQQTWSSFVQHCGSPEQALLFTRQDVANFISVMYDKGAKGSKVDATLSALDRTRAFFKPGSTPLAQDDLIKHIKKAATVRRPSPKQLLKNEKYYDPLQLLDALSLLGPLKAASCITLRLRTAVTLLVDGALRVNELTSVYTENMEFGDRRLIIKFPFTKEKRRLCWTTVYFYCSCLEFDQSSNGRETQEELMSAKKEKEHVAEEGKSDVQRERKEGACSFCTARAYFLDKRVVKRRERAGKVKYETPEGFKLGTPFLVTHKAQAAQASLDTIRKDVIQAMKDARIPSIWTVHSIRGATVSKIRNLGVDLQRVLDFGRWSVPSTFLQHYFRRNFYKEESSENNKKPIWWVIRARATEVEHTA